VEKLLDSKTIWLCAACQTCYTRCPKGIDLSRIMEALREIVMLEKGSHINYDALDSQEEADWPQQAFIGGFRKYTV
jgi:heterodisulfide reductase subunit C2